MGRSQETYNKREKEKKRLKKKQDKLQKKEDRKTSGEKNSSLDDMIVYVDEYGNFTSEPPDPKKKEKIKSEDIQIGVAPQPEPDPLDLLKKGKVTFFNQSKGYGFIKQDNARDSIFFHINGLIDDVVDGDIVTFETEKGPKGLNAINVKLFNAE